ncbi:MAG: 50S ribosomal protein L19, partial [Geobacter sp.]|nr:50S ribosomal protein L19 [Geobacter sp.]
MNTIDIIEFEQMKKNTPVFKTGDTVKVHVKIVEGDKQRIQ